MMAKLIVATVFLWAVCHVTAAVPTLTTLQTNITRAGCNSTKQCWSVVADCDPSLNTSCYFTSINTTNGSVFIELSGPTSGFVALGLSSINNTANVSDVVFVCGKNSTNSSFFFDTTSRNNTVMSSANVSTVHVVQHLLNSSQIQCAFNISNLTVNSANFPLINNTFTIINGTTNGAKLENIATVLQFIHQLNLTTTTTNTTNTTTTNTTSSTSPINITRNGCGVTKVCFSNSSCDPAVNSSCFFASTTLKNQTYSYELSGSSNGYIALALTKQNKTYVFVCGNNTNNGSFFFQTTYDNNTALTPSDVTVYNVSGAVSKNSSLIQCTFDTNTTFNQSFSANDSSYIMAVYSGSTNGTQLGSPNRLFSSGTPLNLSTPTTWSPTTTTTAATTTTTAAPTTNSGNSLAGLWTHGLAVLFSAISLHFITSHSP